MATKHEQSAVPIGKSTEGAAGSNDEIASPKSSESERPSLPARIWNKIGLDVHLLMMMFKGSLPPVIAIALYQYDPFARTFPTIGYLVAIMSVLSVAVMPRSKFFQTMIFNLFGVCIGASVALLTCYCSVQARAHTSNPASTGVAGASGTSQAVQYNSSASAVSGIWLFFNIGIANALRFSRPQLQLPIIIYSIFAMISGTFAPLFADMTQSIAFVKMLIEAFASGFAISTVVNLVVFPTSSRTAVFKHASDYFLALREGLDAELGFLRTFLKEHTSRSNKGAVDTASETQSAGKELKGALSKIAAVHGKLHGELVFAKREVAFGHLDAKDLDTLFRLFRQIAIPLFGIGSTADAFEKLQERTYGTEASEGLQAEDWNEIVQVLLEPLQGISDVIKDGLDHVSWALKISKRPVSKTGKSQRGAVEADQESLEHADPGSPKFADFLEARIKSFWEYRKQALKVWCLKRNIDYPEDESSEAPLTADSRDSSAIPPNERHSSQLYLALYLETLHKEAASAVLAFVRFADSKVDGGVMKRKRLLLPGKRRIKKWILGCLKVEDASVDHAPDTAEASMFSIALGDAFKQRKDPEHLPPTNAWQRFGDWFRRIFKTLSSAEVSFGFRVACATMSIAIIAYLETTQTFFVQQRIVWAMIMVAIGMTMTSGSGVFGLLARVAGTVLATAFSLLIWYIAGGQGTPGAVIPVLWVFIFIEYYFFLKFPQYMVVALLSIVTQVLILGYELQAGKIGTVAIASNGQLYYPVYLLAPYRLATVSAGCFIAFIWMYFPYPITAQSTLRRQLGESLYLLANYYSLVHTMVGTRLKGDGGDPEDKSSPLGILEKEAAKLIGKLLAINSSLKQHSAFVAFDLNLGGKFPKKQYDDLIDEVQELMKYMTLISYSTAMYSRKMTSVEEFKWLADLKRLVGSVDVTSQEITSFLILMSSSLINGTPLPPYLKPPSPFQLNAKLRELDPEILSVKHAMEPGYAAFAVTQVTSRLISDNIERVLSHVRALVGEVDFSFHLVSTKDSSLSTLELEKGGKGKQE